MDITLVLSTVIIYRVGVQHDYANIKLRFVLYFIVQIPFLQILRISPE